MTPDLTAELRGLLATVTDDLRERSERDDVPWAVALRTEYHDARQAGRTAFTWSQWRDGEIDQGAVAWVLGTVFVRFCEDNDLVANRWIAGPSDGLRLAVDAESAFYAAHPHAGTSDWLRIAFGALADLPSTGGILDREHALVWRITPGDDVCRDLLTYWRTTGDGGVLTHSLASEDLDTRFLGDLYQDLSELAKKKYALLQTPEFVEEFILDRTLTPAITEFGLPRLRLIDPTCGSGHFLLGAFGRLLAAWKQREPAAPAGENVRRALASVYGVDLNPFAAAIARFRLAVAALRASGFRRLQDAPKWDINVAIGDSLLGGVSQGSLIDESGAAGFHYRNEDITEFPSILEPGRYHVVVGNPPYITVKDKALNEAYRQSYKTCHRQYALSVPFMELFFRLAIRGTPDQPAGYVGQITSNSFMKREFGTKVIETLLSGAGGPDAGRAPNPVDLLDVIDTSGAYIPGHGTPTVILIGRRQRPARDTVHAILGVRGEPGQPADASQGLVWSEIVGHINDTDGYNGDYVTITNLSRETLAHHPWSLSGGGASEVKASIEGASAESLAQRVKEIGFGGVTREDDVYVVGNGVCRRNGVSQEFVKPLIEGEFLRDFALSAERSDGIWPYSDQTLAPEASPEVVHFLWPWKRQLSNRVAYGLSQIQRGLPWFAYSMFFTDRYRTPLSVAFAFVATHNHFVLDRGGKVFNRSAPVIKLPADATVADHLGLLGVLNSSVACFWLKQVSHNKGGPGGGSSKDEKWRDFYEFTGTKLQEYPLPAVLPVGYGYILDTLAQETADLLPAAVLARLDDGAVPTRELLDNAHSRWLAVRAQMVAWQEELDWHTYRLYGLLDEDLTYTSPPAVPPELAAATVADSADATGTTDEDMGAPTVVTANSAAVIPPLELGQRVFEIVLVRAVEEGRTKTRWFDDFGGKPSTHISTHLPSAYQRLLEARLDVIETNPAIKLLEQPDFKRSWDCASWDAMESAALTDFVLDRLEAPDLWSDAQGPRVLSVAQLADAVRHDGQVQVALSLRFGVDADRVKAIGALVAGEAVPFTAALRYTEAGMRKRAEWEAVWELQRAEDAGAKVDIPVPPKYTNKDFRKPTYWTARGKLDVPKERFISYPGCEVGADASLVVGWAGWDHAEQARALARLLLAGVNADGWDVERVTPVLAGLVELEPWLHQWHAEAVSGFPTSPAQAISGLLDQRLAAAGLTRQQVAAWRPPTPVRGGRRVKGS